MNCIYRSRNSFVGVTMYVDFLAVVDFNCALRKWPDCPKENGF